MANLRSMIEIEIIKEQSVYRMLVPQGVPYSEAHDVCSEMAAVILEWERQSKEILAKKENPEAANDVEPVASPEVNGIEAELVN